MLVDKDGAFYLGYAVTGFVCQKCHEELIDRHTALELQNAQTPVVAWTPTETTQLSGTVSDLITAPASTLAIAA
jgi:hypothetical protein